ncbi:hypothetical protein D3C84_852100 [compost metagenome]
MCDPVGVVVPGMDFIRLVPDGRDVHASLGALLHDHPGIGRIVRFDVQHEVALGLGDQGSDVSDTFLAVAFGDQG